MKVFLLFVFLVWASPAYAEMPEDVPEDVPAPTATKPRRQVGEVIKAEFVDFYWNMGYDIIVFCTQDIGCFEMRMDPSENCTEEENENACDSVTREEAIEGDLFASDDGDYVYAGRQMLIQIGRVTSDDAITASSIRLDPDPNAPKNRFVLPHQVITGKISCDEDFHISITTPDKKRYIMEQPRGVGGMDFMGWCRLKKTVTLHGMFVGDLDGDERLFYTRETAGFLQ